MKRLFLILTVAGCLAGVAFAGSLVTVTGPARWNDRLVAEASISQAADLSARASFSSRPKWVKVWLYRTNGDFGVECQALTSSVSGQVSCVIPGAPAGSYRAEFWPSSGKVIATLEISGS